MAFRARRWVIFGLLAVLLTAGLLGAPAQTPAQATETAVPPTSTSVPPTDTPIPTEAATLAPTDIATATTVPSATAVPTTPPTQIAPTVTPPPISAANHAASISPTQTTVNNWVNFTLANYPANTTVHILWTRNTGSVFEFATTTTNGSGAASGRFRAPAVTGGPNQIVSFVSGDVT
jgi:hypothetical protein